MYRRLSVLNIFIFLLLLLLSGCSTQENHAQMKGKDKMEKDNSGAGHTQSGSKYETATFGTGCFWCTEAVFQRIEGVVKVESGYSGGSVPNPTYEAVCTGKTGHAEVCQITYDPEQITYGKLLTVFWKTHDPTTLNRQGNDVGTQYRSVIFYHNEDQRTIAEAYKKELIEKKAYKDPIVTEIAPFKKFYKAENYHQNYYNNNSSQPYCSFVIAPKLEKLEKIKELEKIK